MSKPKKKPAPKKKAAPKKKNGRPSLYTQELADTLCEHIANGGSLRVFCAIPGNPDLRTVRRWLQDKEGFRLQYTQARADQADMFVDDITRIADTEEDPNVARVRIDARKWAAGKLAPKKYGDKLHTEIDAKVETTEVLSDRDFARWLAFKLHKGAMNGHANEHANGHARDE